MAEPNLKLEYQELLQTTALAREKFLAAGTIIEMIKRRGHLILTSLGGTMEQKFRNIAYTNGGLAKLMTYVVNNVRHGTNDFQEVIGEVNGKPTLLETTLLYYLKQFMGMVVSKIQDITQTEMKKYGEGSLSDGLRYMIYNAIMDKNKTEIYTALEPDTVDPLYDYKTLGEASRKTDKKYETLAQSAKEYDDLIKDIERGEIEERKSKELAEKKKKEEEEFKKKKEAADRAMRELLGEEELVEKKPKKKKKKSKQKAKNAKIKAKGKTVTGGGAPAQQQPAVIEEEEEFVTPPEDPEPVEGFELGGASAEETPEETEARAKKEKAEAKKKKAKEAKDKRRADRKAAEEAETQRLAREAGRRAAFKSATLETGKEILYGEIGPIARQIATEAVEERATREAMRGVRQQLLSEVPTTEEKRAASNWKNLRLQSKLKRVNERREDRLGRVDRYIKEYMEGTAHLKRTEDAVNEFDPTNFTRAQNRGRYLENNRYKNLLTKLHRASGDDKPVIREALRKIITSEEGGAKAFYQARQDKVDRMLSAKDYLNQAKGLTVENPNPETRYGSFKDIERHLDRVLDRSAARVSEARSSIPVFEFGEDEGTGQQISKPLQKRIQEREELSAFGVTATRDQDLDTRAEEIGRIGSRAEQEMGFAEGRTFPVDDLNPIRDAATVFGYTDIGDYLGTKRKLLEADPSTPDFQLGKRMQTLEKAKKANYQRIWAAEGTVLKSSAMDTTEPGFDEEATLRQNLVSFMSLTEEREKDFFGPRLARLGENTAIANEVFEDFINEKVNLELGTAARPNAKTKYKFENFYKRKPNGQYVVDRTKLEPFVDELRARVNRKIAIQQIRNQLKKYADLEQSALLQADPVDASKFPVANPYESPLIDRGVSESNIEKNDTAVYRAFVSGIINKSLARGPDGLPLTDENDKEFFAPNKTPYMFFNYTEQLSDFEFNNHLQKYEFTEHNEDGKLVPKIMSENQFVGGKTAVFEHTYLGSHQVLYGHSKPTYNQFPTNLGGSVFTRNQIETEDPFPVRQTDLRNPLSGSVPANLKTLGSRKVATLEGPYDQILFARYNPPVSLKAYDTQEVPLHNQPEHLVKKGIMYGAKKDSGYGIDKFNIQSSSSYGQQTRNIREGRILTVKKKPQEARDAFRSAQRNAAMGLPYGFKTFSQLRK